MRGRSASASGRAQHGVRVRGALVAGAALAVTACGGGTAPAASSSPPVPASSSAAPASASATPAPATLNLAVTDNTWTDAVDPAAIPLGDGRLSTQPRSGYVDTCTTSFRGGGAEHAGPWLDASAATWDAQTKPAVEGRHLWPDASFRVSLQGSTRVITTNDLPVDEPTGTFPIATADPAYQYDHNPNSIVAQSLTYDLPAHPAAAATPSCTGLGPIGVTADGVLLFNALDAAGRDAGAHELQDACHGHPNGQDEYHYHSISDCLMTPERSSSQLVGYALDGYGIYAEWNAQGNLPTDADLDACHGRTSTVLWDGTPVTMYHYDVTLEYPYTVGCFHGTPIAGTR